MKKKHKGDIHFSFPQFPQTIASRIFEAISNSDIEHLKSLDDMSVEPGIVNAFGDSTIFCAIRKGNIEILSQLIRLQGKDIVKAEDSWEESPLHVAVYSNKLEAVRFLVNNGADLQASDRYGATPLLRALKYIASDRPQLDKSSSSQIGGDKTKTDRMEIVKFLLENSNNEHIYPPHLLILAQSHYLNLLEQVLKLGIDAYCQNSALKHAVVAQNSEVVSMLLAYGANTDDINADISNDIKIKTLIKCANAIDSLCASLEAQLANSPKFHATIELEKIQNSLASLNDSEKLALSQRAFFDLVGDKNLSIDTIYKKATEFVSVISHLIEETGAKFDFLNLKFNEILDEITKADLAPSGGVPSLFYQALQTLKSHGLWMQAITKNSEGVSAAPQDIIDSVAEMAEAQEKLKECFLAARINLTEGDIDALNNLGDSANIYNNLNFA